MKSLSFLGFPCHFASPEGYILNLTTGKIFKQSADQKARYMNVTLCHEGKTRKMVIARIIALAFLGSPPSPRHQVNHKDGIRHNNRVDNLEWVSPQENSQHAYDTGLSKTERLCGEKEAYRIHEVCRLLEQGYRNKEVAESTGFKSGFITDIKCGRAYPEIRSQYNIHVSRRSKVNSLSPEKVVKICEMLSNGVEKTVIEKELSVSNESVRRIFKRLSYTDISKNFYW